MSIFQKAKPLVKAAIPNSFWQRIRGLTRESWLFGILFTLFYREYRSDGFIFEIPKRLFPIPLRTGFFFDGYERAEREKIEALIHPEDSVIELGGAIGVISCVTNRILRNKTSHVVVEPHPEALPFLYRNRAHNHAEFLVINSVISPNKIENFTFGDQLHNSRVRMSDQAIRITGITMGELNKKYGPFSVLIMDIEGAEKFVVDADATTIASFRLVILELHPCFIGEEACDAIRQKFTELGFAREGEKSCVEAWIKQANPPIPSVHTL
ncbi:MAG: FkbM family methyltransferase [bacterium]